MSGIIDGSSILSTTGMFNNYKINQVSNTSDSNTKNVTGTKKPSFQEQMDSVDISGVSREIPQAGYSKPVMKVTAKETEEETEYKAIDSEGIQEGVELSDAAKNLLKELQEKYGDTMDIYVANWSSDDEQDYYATLSDKQYSALINPELLEEMAADESVREKYESVLASAGDNSDTLKEGVGEEIANDIKSFSVSMDGDGNVTYMVQLLKDFADNNTVKANSLEELIELLKEKYEEKNEDTEDETEVEVSENIESES